MPPVVEDDACYCAAVRQDGEGASADVGGSTGGGGSGAGARGGLTLLESRRGRVLRARGAGGCRRRQRQLSG